MKVEEWKLKLDALDQSHLFTVEGQTDVDRLHIIHQLQRVEDAYAGGLASYIENARRLLGASARNENPYDGMKPSIPPLRNIDPTNVKEFMELEAQGRKCLGRTAFVLVAGGLGERLGYPDIKLKLYTQVTEPMSYLEYYCKTIKRCEEVATRRLPFFIMTSADTHVSTVEYLKNHEYFGLDKQFVIVEQQEKVPALADMSAHIALKSASEIETKPHGHGDVHVLLQKHLDNFEKNCETEWLFFFQDTNALAMRALQVLLGVSVTEHFAMNSLAIPRRVGEAVGALCQLQSPERSVVINVEYCQLDGLLRSNNIIENEQDESYFPGNANILLFHLPDYRKALHASKGLVPEFVNPKFSDATKQSFKSPTRLECMMQDIPLCFERNQVHGCTVMPRWFCFSTCKNSAEDAAKKTTPSDCAFTAECEFYENARKCVELAAKHLAIPFNSEEPREQTFLGVRCSIPPRVLINPEAAVSLSDIVECLQSANVKDIHLSHSNVLHISKTNNFVIKPAPDFQKLTSTELTDAQVSDNYKIRGYRAQ